MQKKGEADGHWDEARPIQGKGIRVQFGAKNGGGGRNGMSRSSGSNGKVINHGACRGCGGI